MSANRVTQIKTAETDGYNAVQVTYGSKRPAVLLNAAGHFAKAGVEAGLGLVEFPLTASDLSNFAGRCHRC